MPKILVIRNNGITAEIEQSDGQTTSYAVSGAEPITLLHESHFETIFTNFCGVTGKELTMSEFLSMVGIADLRTPTVID